MRNRPALALEVVSRLRRVMTSLDTVFFLASTPVASWPADPSAPVERYFLQL
jgi:hypothetical protein